ncbi:FMN-linked oxidoreductase [Trametes versicolor FP-101664 SS1]|uniref:FMN-linked oxidoreductase n=1 Tax=Trametes versicolor (strain FP-101664) TaxID=717944 RepID=UPI00046229F2|nr:FMN-linked oxidoreductase [Trametes versicolor FP-101664 SS1]EIW53159.1 FMN-linked oxidoreductase [Trametes versicolor FP-101664 SS1]
MAQFITEGAPNMPYFTPAQKPPAGTAAPSKDGTPIPSLFQPIKIRGVEFQNRLFVSPMGLSSGNTDGSVTAFHTAILGAVILRGPGLTIIEATAVSPEGRGTLHDCGLWSDAQIAPLRELVQFAHSQGQKIGVQLGHAGRKGSTAPLWLAPNAIIPKALGGWPEEVLAPSPNAYKEGDLKKAWLPKELTKDGIREVVGQWAAAAKRAVVAGIDVIEIHAGHGYLLHEFLSPVANKRTDDYGGSFENRARIVIEVVDAIRKVIPDSTPLFLRLSATDWLEKIAPNESSWQLDDTVRLAGIAADHGVDLIDVSSGGIDSRQKLEFVAYAYQAHFAEAVKKAHGDRVLVGTVGGIKTGKLAQEVLDKGQADVVLAGQAFLKDPAAVVTFAADLGVDIKLANQLDWVTNGRGSIWRWKQ